MFGLPPDADLRMPHRYLGLVPNVPALLQWQDVPPTVHLLRPQPFDTSGSEDLPEWALNLSEQPTVYATLGTIVNRSPGIFAAILDGLRDEPITLILTIGRNQDPADFGPRPPNVYIERYLPQTLLLPYCDLVVTHGGFNTVQAALCSGLPMVILPVAADQHVNAEACARIGVGRVVGPEERTPENIRAAVREVLANGTYRAKAERIQNEIAAMPGAEYAVELLERLAAEKQPLLSVAIRT
jgi:MGT family glycosyltransferase